jgi:hypothetical protein
MKIFSFGCSGEERAHTAVGTFVPYASGKGPGTFVPSVPGKGPIKFVSAGNDFVGGGIAEGLGQGAGIAFGLILAGTAFAWVKTHAVTK